MRPVQHGFVLLSAVASVAIAVWISAQLQVAPEAAAPEIRSEASRLEQLERRLRALESAAEADGAVAVRARDGATEVRDTDQEARLRAIESRLERVERRAAPSRASVGEAVSTEDGKPGRNPRLDAADAKRILASRSATIDEKVRAHERLRRVPDAYTPQMIQDLIRVAQTDPRPAVRAHVWTCFDGATRSQMLVEPLLHSMRFDADDKVRAEAAETLGNYRENPAVMQALELVVKHDKSGHVREKAGRSVPRR